MSAQTFEKSSFGWQLQQLQQRFGEWLELVTRGKESNVPNLSLPPWLLDLLWQAVRVVFWLLLGLLLIWGCLQLWRQWGHYLYSFPSLRNSSAKQTATPDSKLTVSTWLARSRECYLQGNYSEAVRCLYMAMLQRLNDTNLIPLEPSRTDGEYRQLTLNLSKQESYQVLLTTHEEMCFGNASVSPEVFERCQRAYQDIEEQK